MKQQRLISVGLSGSLVLMAGCPFASGPSGTDPRSDAPELAGRWCLQGDEQGFVGYFELDDTGDPISLEDNPVVLDQMGENTLLLDGSRHRTNAGLQYTGIASVSADGTEVELYVEIHVFTFGFEVGALAMKFEGERVSTELLEGITVTIQDFPGEEAADLIIQTATARKDSCD
jgi:hypothetical protein